MAKNREQKKQIIEDLKNAFSQSKTIVMTDPHGLKMDEMNKIRDTLSEKGIQYQVAKKNLVKLAEKDAGYKFDPTTYEGSTGLVFGYEDEIEPIKLIHQLSKQFENLKIRGGIFEKKFIDLATFSTLAAIPSREILYAQLVGSIASPMSGIVNVMTGNIRNLVNVLKNYQEKIS